MVGMSSFNPDFCIQKYPNLAGVEKIFIQHSSCFKRLENGRLWLSRAPQHISGRSAEFCLLPEIEQGQSLKLGTLGPWGLGEPMIPSGTFQPLAGPKCWDGWLTWEWSYEEHVDSNQNYTNFQMLPGSPVKVVVRTNGLTLLANVYFLAVPMLW